MRCVSISCTGNTRLLKVIMDEANNQIELTCIRIFEQSQQMFDRINGLMVETEAKMEKAKTRHNVVIQPGFGTGMRPYGHAVVHV